MLIGYVFERLNGIRYSGMKNDFGIQKIKGDEGDEKISHGCGHALRKKDSIDSIEGGPICTFPAPDIGP